MKTALMIAALIGAASLAYLNSLPGQFVYDDKPIILKNPLVHSLKQLPMIFGTPYWGTFFGQPADAAGALYRPLTTASFALNYFFSGTDPEGYHLTNLILHIAVTLLLGILCLRLGLRWPGAWAASLMFALLPIHTEAVSNIVGRSEVLAAFFILLSWIAVTGRPSRGRVAMGAIFFILALLSKENAAAFLGVLIFSDYILDKGSGKEIVKKRLLIWIAYAGGLLLYLQWRYLMIGSLFNAGGIPYFTDQNRAVIFLTMTTFITRHYLLPLLTGMGLSADFTRPILQDANLHHAATGINALLLCGALGFIFYQSFKTKNRVAWYAAIFFIFLFPALNLLARLEVIGAERFLYLPSIASCMGMGFLFEKAFNAGGMKKVGSFILLASLCVWYGTRTYVRNNAWRTEESFWKTMLQDAPQSPRAWNGWGFVLMNQKRYDEAIAAFNQALGLNRMLLDADYNMATCFFLKEDYARAKRGYLYVLQFKPYDPDTLFHLAVLSEKEKDYAAAGTYYKALLRTNPLDRIAAENIVRIEGIRRRSGVPKRGTIPSSSLKEGYEVRP